ncbi:hypothetical protein MKZ38_004140 [Zalerion maritima]|uniref:Nitrogen regulatory protein areA GATA-like domain-containing protein n=1 Tax=Zalerion maritima TaxID=339359 RepID=A0AAD5WQ57_9PEZI|nr:hypothetical protein MKZ38_004140 [Zalerion maritima]
MPVSLETPVLTVDANVIHKIDTGNPQNLFSMWTVFSKCVDSVEQGRRLENLSWRLWTRETFCVEEEQKNAAFTETSEPRDIPPISRILDCPQLSGSVDSVVDEEAVELNNEADPLEIRPTIVRQDSCASSRSRGRERHITSGDLEKMVVDIIKQKEPLTAPLPSIPCPVLVNDENKPKLERTGSTTTESTDKTSDEQSEDSQAASTPDTSSSMKPTTNVVLGFSPSAIPFPKTIAPVTSQSSHMIPEPSSSPAAKLVQPKKGKKFDIGPSSSPDSYSDAASSPNPQPQQRKIIPQQKKNTFMIGAASSDESSGNNSVRPSMLAPPKKHAAFNKVSSRSAHESSAVADDSESEGDYVDESAIDDDDDSSDWEDSIEDSGKSSFDDKNMFQRVDSKANLTSRRSLITLMIEQNDQRTNRIHNPSSQSTSALNHVRARAPLPAAPAMLSSPNDSDESPLTMKRGMRGTPLKPINEVSRTAAQPIMTTNHVHQQAALSPRTTRRNMLATELTESLRRHLLWERQQKSSTANAVLKRRHTSHDVANLKQYPERPYLNKAEDANASSWNEYWTKEAFNGYHTQGW